MIHNMTRGKDIFLNLILRYDFFSCYNILERTSTAVLDSSPPPAPPSQQYALKPGTGLFPDAVLKDLRSVAKSGLPLLCSQSVITKRECVFIVFLYPLRSLLEVVSRQNGRTDIWTHFCCVFPLQ